MKKIFILAISSLIFFSCNNTTKEVDTNAETTTKAVDSHSEDESSAILELNKGEKWVVNEEMKPFVSKQEELLNAYIQTDESDYKKFAKQLQEQNQKLIKSCTMTGKSHDELHKWLHPYITLLGALGEAETKADADKLVVDITTSFETYHAYFQ